MAKRARGTTTRPGQRAPLQRGSAARQPLANPVAAPRPTTLTDEEEARAAELEARILAAERAAEAATVRRVGRRPSADADASVRTGSIAVRAGQEYAYVVRDMRRIAVIGGSMLAILLGIWIVVQVTGTSLA